MVISFLHWKIKWLSETESTVTSRFEILTMLLGRRAPRCTWGPGSLGCLTFGWPWEDALAAPALPLSLARTHILSHFQDNPGALARQGKATKLEEPARMILPSDPVITTVLHCELPQARVVALASL